MARNKKLIIHPEMCKACGICVEFCPKKALALRGKVVLNENAGCILCGLCEQRCPDYAIYLEAEEEDNV